MPQMGHDKASLAPTQGRHATKRKRRGGRQGPSRYLNHGEAAQFLRISQKTLHRWCRNPEFAAIVNRSKVGPPGSYAYLYPRDRLERYVQVRAYPYNGEGPGHRGAGPEVRAISGVQS